MLTIKDKIEQFKRDCKSNDYYTKMIIDCNERLEEIANELSGIKAVSPKGVIYENCGDPYKENKLHWLYLEEQIIRERDEYIKRINDVSSKLMKITNPVDRNMITDLYIDKKYYKSIVDKYHYNDYSALKKHTDKVIGKIV